MGDGTFITGPSGEHILVDFGSTKSRTVAPPDAIIYMKSQLEKRNPPRLDLLVLTHPDQDHYNQLKALFEAVDGLEVDRVLFAGQPKSYKVGNFYDAYLKGWITDGTAKAPGNSLSQKPSDDPFFSTGPNNKKLEIWILSANYPDKDANANLLSAVLLCQFKGIKVILPGDATQFTEKFILKQFGSSLGPLSVDLLKLPHHGSETSSSTDWVNATKPEVITVSGDTNPSYGLPRCNVIERYFTHVGGSSNEFPCVCYVDETTGFEEREIKKFVLCSLTKSTQGTQWEFRIKDDGGWSIHTT